MSSDETIYRVYADGTVEHQDDFEELDNSMQCAGLGGQEEYFEEGESN